MKLECNGDEDNLADCLLMAESACSVVVGVICYDLSYTGCFLYVGSSRGDIEAPCNSTLPDLTIANCVSLCYNTNPNHQYAGLYNGDTCLCGSASITILQSSDEGFEYCSTPCSGRQIERCGGSSHVALFNIMAYLQNNVGVAPITCDNATSVVDEESSTTRPVTERMSTTTRTTTTTATATTTTTTTTRGMVTQDGTSMTTDDTSSTASLPRITSPLFTEDPSSGMTQSARTTEERTTRTRTLGPTDTADNLDPSSGMTQSARMTEDRTTRTRTLGPTDTADNLGLYIGVGAGGGVLILIIIILLVVLATRWRRSREKGSSSDHTILELRSRPEGSEIPITSYPHSLPNNYSLENGMDNPNGPNGISDTPATGLDVEESDYSIITDTGSNPQNNPRDSSTYEHVPLHNATSGPRKTPPQPVPRRVSKNDASDAAALYAMPDKSKSVEESHRDSFPEYAVSQKFRKDPIGRSSSPEQPSAANAAIPSDLYAMPNKSKKSIANKDGAAGIDNALYICRVDEDANGSAVSSEYATEKGNCVDDTEMVENELYETSNNASSGKSASGENCPATDDNTEMIENELYHI